MKRDKTTHDSELYEIDRQVSYVVKSKSSDDIYIGKEKF